MALPQEFLSSSNISDLRATEVGTAQANQRKVQEEVFALSLQNFESRIKASEFARPDRRAARSALVEAEDAKAHALTSTSLMSMRDDDFEVAETALALAFKNPGQESYKAARMMLTKADPYLSSLIPQKFSPQGLQVLKDMSEAALRTKTWRQKMEAAGFDRQFQAEQLKDKARYATEIQAARYGWEEGLLKKKLHAGLEEAGIANASREMAARIASSPYEVMALEAEKNGLPPSVAAGWRMMAVQHALLELEAKQMAARNKGSVDMALRDKHAVDLSESIYESVEDSWTGNYQLKKAVGIDRRTKKLKATGGKGVAMGLTRLGTNQGIGPLEISAWVADRMAVDLSKDVPIWKPLLTDSTGNLVAGIGLTQIIESINRTPNTLGWTGGKIGGIKEALKYYKFIMKKNDRTW